MNGEDENNIKYYSSNKEGMLYKFRHFSSRHFSVEHFAQYTFWEVDILR